VGTVKINGEGDSVFYLLLFLMWYFISSLTRHSTVHITKRWTDADKPARLVQRSVKVSKRGTIRYVRYGFLLVCYSKCVANTRRFSDIQLLKMSWPWNRGKWSHNVIESDTHRPIYDFLLTLHNNQGTISYRFRDTLWFQSKIAEILHPAEGVPRK